MDFSSLPMADTGAFQRGTSQCANRGLSVRSQVLTELSVRLTSYLIPCSQDGRRPAVPTDGQSDRCSCDRRAQHAGSLPGCGLVSTNQNLGGYVARMLRPRPASRDRPKPNSVSQACASEETPRLMKPKSSRLPSLGVLDGSQGLATVTDWVTAVAVACRAPNRTEQSGSWGHQPWYRNPRWTSSNHRRADAERLHR